MKQTVQNAFKIYFDKIKQFDVEDSSEHTLRTALENLLEALAKPENPDIKIIHEPKRDKSGKGAPDFKFKLSEAILGYLENKKTSENLDVVLKSSQIAKYKQLSGNIIITNYLEWIWLKDGQILKQEILCSQSDVGNRRATLDLDKATKVAALIASFYSTPPKQIAKAQNLALALATRCHDLRDALLEELLRQEKEDEQGPLWGLYGIFKKEVFHELEVGEFADAFAQTLAYGLFLARLNMKESDQKLNLDNVTEFIPASFTLISELVNFLKELKKEDYLLARQPVDEILSIMNTLDITAINEDLAFTKTRSKLNDPSEEERLLFAKDPYAYFYEDFLKNYDASTRKNRGVYYTPPPIVNFIVRAINDTLKDTFGISQGLADRKQVTVLDFATGTGTFLAEVLQQIFENLSEGLIELMVREHALKNLYGFEYLIAPYTIAHLKLSQFLRDKGYTLQSRERIQIYLTNTLEPISPQKNFLVPALSKEVKWAQAVKDKSILVITGNPPYNVNSRNNGDWINKLIKDYYKVDDKPLGEKNSKNLRNDYVKFIRFAQWKIDQVDEGIVGIITSHSFLDNYTFRGMRQSLMKTFNCIYILDLHGNSTKIESSTNRKDENVFDIEQGVAISIFIKKPGLSPKIYRADLWGKRKDKYLAMMEKSLADIEWQEVQPSTPYYLFEKQDEKLEEVYNKGISLAEIFKVQSTGVKTHRDHFVIDVDEAALRKRIEEFRNLEIADGTIEKKYTLASNRDWDLSEKRRAIAIDTNYKAAFGNILYFPYDKRHYFQHEDAVDWPRTEVMRHMLKGSNVALIAPKQTKNNWDLLVTDVPAQHKVATRYDTGYYFPLYLYNFADTNTPKDTLFDDPDDPFQGKDKIENLKPKFRKFIDEKYSDNDYAAHYSPEQILGYIYAVLHSPTYRAKYELFLKRDFARVPFVDDRTTFDTISALGQQLMQAHLLKVIPSGPKVELSKGTRIVSKPRYDEENQCLYFNNEQYFHPVTPEVWEFEIGGYPVLDKYFKSRKGRELSFDEVDNIMNVVKIAAFTIEQMLKIDEIWQP